MGYNFKPLGIKITEDPTFTGNLYGVSNNIVGKFQEIRDRIEKLKDKRIIGELINLIDEHPEVPMLKNYLAIAYTLRKMDNESKEIVLQTVIDHPDYLFGKIALANLYIDEKRYSEVPAILGNEMDIRKICPDRKTFHLSEMVNFYKVAVRYFAAVKDFIMPATG
ncbi:MAG: SEC-C motif domain-containing [Prolixibacteraceae bacterium]|nr:MAG: SEC-C motif domain-containing [Prolixibacteraceae bacterium]